VDLHGASPQQAARYEQDVLRIGQSSKTEQRFGEHLEKINGPKLITTAQPFLLEIEGILARAREIEIHEYQKHYLPTAWS
jgi:hypothetical protein